MLEKYLPVELTKDASEELVAIIERYNEPHRHYHNTSHLVALLEAIEHDDCYLETKLALALVAIFHDAVYDPRRKDNEELSAELASNFLEKYGKLLGIGKELQIDIVQTILDTKNHHLAASHLSKRFCELDLASLLYGDIAKLVSDEQKLFREFQYRDVTAYKQGRRAFLTGFIENWKDKFPEIETKLLKHLEYIDAWVPKIGIYAGSFNPFHVGHLDVLEKAEKVFDKVVVARGINASKMTVLENHAGIIKPFSESTMDSIKATKLDKILPIHETIFFTTLLSDVVKHYRPMGDVTVIRGLRDGFDLQAESNLVAVLKDIDPDSNVIYIPCANNLSHVSSSVIRQLESFGAEGNRYRVTKFDYLTKS